MKTLILILLDESGSMASQMNDVIGGFNTFIHDQKKIKEDEAYVTFIKFNTQVSVVLKCEPVENVPELQFKPGGGTCLYDAIWDGVQLVEEMESKFDRIICVIMTDGEDNSSRKITNEGIATVIKKKEQGQKWTFIYIGENPERWAKQSGMSINNVCAYNHKDQRSNYVRANDGVRNIRIQDKQQLLNVFHNVD